MNTPSKLGLTLTALAASLYGTQVFAQTQGDTTTPPGTTQLQRVEVTGSNIKRIDAETVSPVQVITRDQIERTGQATVAEVLRNLPSNSGSFGESFSNSFAPGAAGISLRGLGQKTTLVLLNGRRVAGYGFAQNLQDTFVDLNSIPSSAVERVDILLDGASAIYGSDAIAGVVNIILRKDFKGFDVTASSGYFEGKNDYRVTGAGGFGDLASDGYNVFAALDYYKRDLLLQGDTEFGKTRDFRKYAGGRNFQALTTGGTWRQLSAAGALTNNYQAITDCGGTVMTGPQALEAGLINTTLATAGPQSAATNTYCTRDYKDQFTALPGTERYGLISRATKQLSPEATAYVELGLSRVDTFQTFQAPFFAGTTGLTPGANDTLTPYTYNITFAPGVAGNPFSTNARYTGVMNDLGTRDADIRSDSTRLLAGASYSVGKWDLDSAVGYSRTKTKQNNVNLMPLAGTAATFGVSTDPQPPVPVSTASLYNLDRWTTNSQAVRDALRLSNKRVSTSDMTFIDTKANTTFGHLPGGEIGLAVGAEYRREKLKDQPTELAEEGGILGQGITATNGSRNNYSVFSELSLPFIKAIEVQAALRYDHYSDYGSSTTPKVGLKLKPTDGLLLRANWGKGFRAPTLPEISPSVATFFTSVEDPEDGVVRSVSGMFAGNPNLKAEKSTSRTFGIVFEPNKNFNLGVDLYFINWRNVVASPDFQDLVDASCPDGGPNCPTSNIIIRDPETNFVTTILSNYENLSQRTTSGVDIDGTWRLPTSYGKFTFHGALNYIRSFKEDGEEYVGTNGGSNTIPRIRGNASIDFDYGPWALTGTVNYTHHIRQEAAAASYMVAQDPRFQNGVLPEHVRSQTTLDLFARYNVTKQLQASIGVINVFDRLTPYDPGFSTTALYDFSLYDPRGRQWRATLRYAFQ
ncbi:iron complex outermembrane recepter protein [Roseateles sp. YR242]|uniref:TonB-dependent receptor n=1 Tax=Roseateles sp. YR242 TaxID=1855305 RepID=UPI0008C2E78C|nr:TonB-dependent receptor [Roseateles sp. YR242]SEL29793.1 iron complex outermembrane recepter protein [Roseateles sp. YR242]